jgi:molecular chaperone GrpE
MEDVTFTQAQVDEMKAQWVEAEINPLKAQLSELEQYKPKQKTDAELALEAKQAELDEKAQALWSKEVSVALKAEGLDDFAEFINAKDEAELAEKIQKFKTILGKLEAQNSYKPEQRKASDKFAKMEQTGDTVGMIDAKLNSLFGGK